MGNPLFRLGETGQQGTDADQRAGFRGAGIGGHVGNLLTVAHLVNALITNRNPIVL